jgi:hypothetical protein
MSKETYQQFFEKLQDGETISGTPFDNLLDFRPFQQEFRANHPKCFITKAHVYTRVAGADLSEQQFIAYPHNHDHAQLFAKSDTQIGGPNFYFAGSIAMLKSNTETDTLKLRYLQYSFKQGSPEELSRSIVSKYLGTRQRLIRDALRYAVENEIETIDLSTTIKKSRANRDSIDALIGEDEFSHLKIN